MSIKLWNAVLVLALVVVLGAGGYVLYQNHLAKEAQAVEDARLAEEAAAEAETVERLTQEFDVFLDGFLQDVAKAARAYKKDRRILDGLLALESLSTPTYIEENYNLAESAVMSLRLQMNSVMGLFDDADTRFKAMAPEWPEVKRAEIEQGWADVKEEQAGLYIAYFESEQEMMNAMQDLLGFYNAHRDVLVVDAAHERVLFDDAALSVEHDRLKANVDEIAKMQADLLTN